MARKRKMSQRHKRAQRSASTQTSCSSNTGSDVTCTAHASASQRSYSDSCCGERERTESLDSDLLLSDVSGATAHAAGAADISDFYEPASTLYDRMSRAEEVRQEVSRKERVKFVSTSADAGVCFRSAMSYSLKTSHSKHE